MEVELSKIADDLYDIADLAEAVDNPELAKLVVFHGGWHHEKSFAFDTRTHGPTGDAAIIPFDDNLTELRAAPKASKVTPFGDWLFARVTKLVTLAERNIRDLA